MFPKNKRQASLRKSASSNFLMRHIHLNFYEPYSKQKSKGYSENKVTSRPKQERKISQRHWDDTLHEYSQIGTELVPRVVSHKAMTMTVYRKSGHQHHKSSIFRNTMINERVETSTNRNPDIYEHKSNVDHRMGAFLQLRNNQCYSKSIRKLKMALRDLK